MDILVSLQILEQLVSLFLVLCTSVTCYLYCTEVYSIYSSFFKNFFCTIKAYLILLHALSRVYWDDNVASVFTFINMMYQFYRFVSVALTLHSRDETTWVMVYNVLKLILNLNSDYILLMIIESTFIKEIHL